jgi:hypothetical protein
LGIEGWTLGIRFEGFGNRMNGDLFTADLKLTPYWWDHVPRPALPDVVLPPKADVVVIG